MLCERCRKLEATPRRTYEDADEGLRIEFTRDLCLECWFELVYEVTEELWEASENMAPTVRGWERRKTKLS